MKILEIQVYYEFFRYLFLSGFEALQLSDSHFDAESMY